jgi:hypothetical protein
LTANLQLRRDHGVPVLAFGVLAPGAGEDGNDALRGPGEASIEGSSARRHPAAEFSSAYRAHGVASDVLCHGPARTGSGLSAGPARRSRQARLRDRLVKSDRFVETRTPSLDECSLPRPWILADRGYGIIESPPPCSRLCRREPASDALSPSEHEAGWLDPIATMTRSDRTRRLSSTSATRTIHEHNHAIIRSPARLIAAAARPACAGRGGDLPDGVEAPSATTTAGSGWHRRLLPSRGPRGPLRRASTWRQPRFHGSGAARHCRPAPRVRWRRHLEDDMALEPRANARSDDGASPQPDPLGHLSSRNRGSTGWRARCYATPPCAQCLLRTGRGVSDDPAARTLLVT